MSRRLTNNEFIEKARSIHGDKYDYSKVKYEHSTKKVCIICPEHGEFLQTPNSHLMGKGCSKCRNESRKKLVYGVGVNDLNLESSNIVYKYWIHILERCYDDGFQKKQPTYIGCTVCDEWKYLSNFKKWFDGKFFDRYWAIDKDIIVKGNKLYSPNTCSVVPQEINALFPSNRKRRGDLPIGVRRSKNKERYVVTLRLDGKVEYLGTFDEPNDAFNIYKDAKEQYIKKVADKWKEQLEPRVYEALYNYKVEITD